jgi:SAM-dependent MidA family methyltransferase
MHYPPLVEFLQYHIAERGQITFAEYMEIVLYAPDLGYYSRGAGIGGAGQDFYTSSHLGTDFGELFAVQLVEFWEVLGKPNPFTLVEMGAGQGRLAEDILRYIAVSYSACNRVLDYVIVERSQQLQQVQQQRLGKQARWLQLEDLAAVTGCFFSNELVDAFPVHRFVLEAGELQEIYVTADFQEVLGPPSTTRLAEYFKLVGIDLATLPSGYQSEVNLMALDWLGQVSRCLTRGYLLTLDYGYPATRYYQPSRRTGTLLAYHQHTSHDQFYHHLGNQDLTAHVDFTALERYGAACGLDKLGFTAQGPWLMALGLGERLTEVRESSQLSLMQTLPRYQALRSLINPAGLGGFGVLLQAKGLVATEADYLLRGWRFGGV